MGVDFISENYGVVGGEDGKVMITQDGGLNWSVYPTSGLHLWHGVYCFNEDSSYVAGTPEGVYKTTDGGQSWVDDYPQSLYNVAFYKIIFTQDNFTGFICGSQGIVMRKTGITAAPSASVSTEEIFFPVTFVGNYSMSSFVLSNTGNAEMIVSDITSDNPVFYSDQQSFSIAPGNSLEIEVFFMPSGSGLFEGTLSISSNDPINPLIEIILQGEGIVPQATISVDTEIVFDTTQVGSMSTYILPVYNIGNIDLEVIDITSSSPDFSVDVTSFVLAPGMSYEVEVSFSPTQQLWYEESLEIMSNDPAGPVTVQLLGFGYISTLIHDHKPVKEIAGVPNPFSNEVMIEYNSENTGIDRLFIYNRLGEEIFCLSNNPAGSRLSRFIWDGTVLDGSPAAKGLYFGIITSGDQSFRIKIIKI